MTMDREEEVRGKKLDMSGKVGVSQCHLQSCQLALAVSQSCLPLPQMWNLPS